MDSMLNLLVYECQAAQFPDGTKRHLYAPLVALDGFVIVTPINQRNFEQLADATGNPAWKTDERFAQQEARSENWHTLMSELEQWTKVRSARQCEDILMSAGVPCSRYLTVSEAITDPQTISRGTMAHAEDAAGPFLVPNAPFKFAHGEIMARPQVPALGQHTRQVLGEFLGMNLNQIDQLMKRAVIAGA
jgi:crotonobetainyl-CoA:carnitine CoA-transferase CaiB-like acyl-CoA transferase